MSEKNPILTFIGKSFAEPGFRFFYSHIPKTCNENCNLFNTCQKNLLVGRVYKIKKVNKKTFLCPLDLHEEEMVLAEVAEEPILITIPTKNVFEGARIIFEMERCDAKDCEYYQYCSPEYRIMPKEKVKIIRQVDKIKNCRIGRQISIVEVEKIDENQEK